MSDEALRALMMRVDATDFPADLEETWRIEKTRFRETLRRIPQAKSPSAVLLDLGSTRAWLPFYQVLLGYKNIVLNTAYTDAQFVNDGCTVKGAFPANVRVSVFDVERNEFPLGDESCDVVLCLEVLEHLAIDPMAMMSEVNRVLRMGGIFLLTTPNAVRCHNVVKMVLGEQPYGWNPYNGFDTNRHNREYTPSEIEKLLAASGFLTNELTTFGQKLRGPARDVLAKACGALLASIRRCPRRWRNDVILASGTKVSSQIHRRPSWLYFDMAERRHASPQGPAPSLATCLV